MAIFRKVHTLFWSDPYIQSLEPNERYFFLYLITNEKTSSCGIYEISKKQISHDTGYSMDTVSIHLHKLTNDEKIKYNESTNEVAVKNWKKYNGSDSPKNQVLDNKELKSIKDKTLIQYLYPNHRV